MQTSSSRRTASRDDVLDDVSFKLRRGEILGVGGLAGQGQPELFMSLFGARRTTRGRISVRGRRARLRRPADAIRHGLAIALVPEDRKTEGLMLPMSVRDNLTLAVLGEVVARRRDPALAREGNRRDGDRTAADQDPRRSHPAGRNALRREPAEGADRPLAAHPARRTAALRHHARRRRRHQARHLRARRQLAAEGKALLYYSSETEEIAQLCNRVLVMREGRVVAELDRNADAEAVVAASVQEARA